MSTITPHPLETATDPAPPVAAVGPMVVITAPTLSEALRFASPALDARLRRLYERTCEMPQHQAGVIVLGQDGRASFDDYLFNALHSFAYGS